MGTKIVYAKADCPVCHGTGYDSVPYGDTNVLMPTTEDCGACIGALYEEGALTDEDCDDYELRGVSDKGPFDRWWEDEGLALAKEIADELVVDKTKLAGLVRPLLVVAWSNGGYVNG